MRLEFDPDKDLLNRLKHGISLGEARSLDWENAIESVDDRHEYGEKRERAVGLLRPDHQPAQGQRPRGARL